MDSTALQTIPETSISGGDGTGSRSSKATTSYEVKMYIPKGFQNGGLMLSLIMIGVGHFNECQLRLIGDINVCRLDFYVKVGDCVWTIRYEFNHSSKPNNLSDFEFIRYLCSSPEEKFEEGQFWSTLNTLKLYSKLVIVYNFDYRVEGDGAGRGIQLNEDSEISLENLINLFNSTPI